jgi:hypothetical protein
LEKDELLVYMGQAGCRDENGALLKPGRIRVKLTPNPFENAEFKQVLKLREGYVLVTAVHPLWGYHIAIAKHGSTSHHPEGCSLKLKLHNPSMLV